MINRRATYYSVQLGKSHSLRVTLRSFRVAKARRSQKFKQIVLSVPFGRTKQVAVRLQKKQASKRRVANTGFIARLQRQAVTPITLMAVGLAGLAFFGIQASLSSQLEPAKAFATAPVIQKPYALSRSVPTHLTIASVGIDADVTPVGLDSNGAIQMPPLFDWTTGWYQNSPTPGEIGPSIIVGHVDTYKGISVFWRLRDVAPNDIVQVTRADGSVARFKITALKQFDQANFPTQEVYGNISYAGLRLITCGGAFDHTTGQYTQNTVVYGVLVH